MHQTLTLSVASVPHRDLAMSNKIFVNPQDVNVPANPPVYVQIGEWVFTLGLEQQQKKPTKS